MGFSFAIIGGGLAGTAMLCQWVERLRQEKVKTPPQAFQVKIKVFEKRGVFGPGFPYSDDFMRPFHITNMCASDMSIIKGKPDDFENWVRTNSKILGQRFPRYDDECSNWEGASHACRHYPRIIMGEYLKARFRQAVKKARQMGAAVDLYPNCEVVDLQPNKGKINLSVRNLADQHLFSECVDFVLLATGHWFEKDDPPNFFNSPWPAQKLLDHIPPGAKVGVIGTSLSAIETVLTLTSDGNFFRSHTGELIYSPPSHSRRIGLYSRRGLLPKVRGKTGVRRNTYFNRKNLERLLSEKRGRPILKNVFDLLRLEMEDAYQQTIDWRAVVTPPGRPVDRLAGYLDDAIHGDGANGELLWQTVLYQGLDMARELYLNLELEEKRVFDRDYTFIFFTYAAPQPRINAEKLLALMQAGVVSVHRLGQDYDITRNDATDDYEITYRNSQGGLSKDAYPYVVNARGQKTSMRTNPTRLARNLLQANRVLTDEIRPKGRSVDSDRQAALRAGNLRIDPKTHQVITLETKGNLLRSSNIYAVGAMTRAQIINASMASAIVSATDRIADHILSSII